MTKVIANWKNRVTRASLHLYLTSNTVHVRRQSGLPWKLVVDTIGQWNWDSKAPESLPLERILAHASTTQPRRLHVTLGASLCKLMVCDLPPTLHDASEKTAVAHAHMMQKLGLEGAEWTCSIDAVHASNKAVVCATRNALLSRLHAITAAQEMKLVSVMPLINGVWNAFQTKKTKQEHTALLAWEDDAFTVLVASQGVIGTISTLLHHREANLVDREIKRLNVSLGSPEPIRLACTNAMASHLPVDYAANLVLARDYLKPGLYADFRDLLFTPAVKDSV